MTTMELIERGIGHNCLSDAYDLGRADALDECEKEIKKHYQYDCEIGGYIRLRELNFEKLKEQK